MADVNERWSVGRAIDIGRRLEEVGLYWLEDPTRGDDYAGLARISAALSTPVMAGENCWDVNPFRLMLESRSVAMVIIDLMNMSAAFAVMKIAAMAEAFTFQSSAHHARIPAQLVAAAPNGLLVEHKAWTWPLFDGLPEFDRGDSCFPTVPGTACPSAGNSRR